ncbi:O-antigen ligase family protein [Enterococcus mundtii]|uniref:Polymerase n=2 Tax=Enterococcus TaxID=1350 RepID=A0ABQ0VAN4_ENTMU|nr:O-antigen ligase family protein [Enterococcus mundtii]GEN16802.1 polymerase [Ligilactobacillus acidipiscis]AUB52121.1 polymerase [Enterococcus mundtii]MZZ57737.1 O-antigen ligase domain-containing protein [Enterococcus mundtii]MZZ60712.1 O-antigen ligase domain-containing protein [Enterococcus mundtii]MZZ67697.1 O-antigen ligase domain-containing protein [Enterococcus mundtii]
MSFMETKKDDYLQKGKNIFIVGLLVLLISRAVGAYSLLPSTIDSVLFSILAIFGSIVLLADFFTRVLKKNRWTYDILLLLFIVIMCISSLINMKYGIFGNLKFIVWQALYFFIVYDNGISSDRNKADHLLSIISGTLIVIWTSLVVVSLGMFLTQYNYSVQLSRVNPLRIGMLEGRLFGVFSDPNYGSVMCVVTIFLSLYYIFSKKYSNKWLLTGVYFSIFLNISYIILSGSRNGLITLLVTTFVFVFFSMYQYQLKKKMNLLLNILLSIVSGVAVMAIVFGGAQLIKIGWSYFPQFFEKKQTGITAGRVNLTRPDVAQSTDVSNLRFTIWKSAVEIFQSSWLFGTSPKNMIAYAQDVLPNTYIAQRNFSVHNAYLNTLASTGILGGLTFVAFIVSKAARIITFLFKPITNLFGTRMIYCICGIFALAFSGFFHNEMILVNISGAFLFWFLLGEVIGKLKASDGMNQ